MAKRIEGSTPKQDGFRMPGEYEPHDKIWMIWPQRTDNWRLGGKPAQEVYTEVAKTISKFTNVTMLVNTDQYQNARTRLPHNIRVIEMSNNDAWCRDCGPIFLVNDKGEIRACDFRFNAWGGLYDGLYYPWDFDDMLTEKVCEIENVDIYKLEKFILEGGSIHVDGEGTVLTTEMCLLSEGRNPELTKEQIEELLCEYLNCEKVLWLKDGIDPLETNGHVDDVACFVRPGEVACIYSEDENDPFYKVAKESYEALCEMVDAKGRKLIVHKVCTPKNKVLFEGAETIDRKLGTIPRLNGEMCNASYLNFLITNGGVIVPQYGDENDSLALEQLQAIFPDKEVVGVSTKEVVFGGGNIHCITMQQPKVLQK